ncbi:MAG: hypothetical protein ABW190_13175 [Rhizobacter sp.]
MNGKTDGKPVNHAEADDEPWLGSGWSLAVIVAAEVAIGTMVLRLGATPAHTPTPQLQAQLPVAATVALQDEKPPVNDAERVARWARAGDAGGRGFVVVDKPNARVIAFDARGHMTHSVPALLGQAKGDDSVPGIGEKPVMQVTPEERITPAGRFVAQLGNNLTGEDIVWIDYDAAVSMHRVRATNPKEKRLERLASDSIDDNRISYGCINLPVAFYEGVLRPMVQAGPTVVYVLPDHRPLAQVFAALSTQ